MIPILYHPIIYLKLLHIVKFSINTILIPEIIIITFSSCSLIIPQIILTMLHPPKLLIHHNYKEILYYYKNFPITIGNIIPLHVIQHIISLLLFSLFNCNSLISSSLKFYFLYFPWSNSPF
jgi:hypothetical protein